MMNKFLAFLVLAASPFFAVQADCNDQLSSKNARLTHYGYFYTTAEQEVLTFDDVLGYDGVVFNDDFGLDSHEVYLDSDDSSIVVLDDRGVYSVTFSVTVVIPDNDDTNVLFALTLNGEIIPGSIYGLDGADGDVVEIVGQILFENDAKEASLQLVNYTDSDVTLDNPLGSSDLTFTTASILVVKLNKYHD